MDEVRQTSRMLTRALDNKFRPLGLRYTQYIVLIAIARHHDKNLTKLAKELLLERSSLNRIVSPLFKKGLLVRIPQPDKKEKVFALTETGQSRIAAGKVIWDEATDLIRTAFDPAKYDVLMLELKRFIVMIGLQRPSD